MIGGSGVNWPVAGVRANSETLAELRLVTKSHKSSERIAIDWGNELTDTVAGVRGDKVPVAELILNAEIVPDPVIDGMPVGRRVAGDQAQQQHLADDAVRHHACRHCRWIGQSPATARRSWQANRH